jgi:hypothetical protein
MKRAGALILILTALALLSPAGCSKPKPKPEPAAKAPLTERQRDSLLAREPIPGAGGVGRALDLSDREAARAAGLGAQVDSLTR